MKVITAVVRPERLPQVKAARVIRIRTGEVDTAAVTAVTADRVQRRAINEANA
jgi:nitrogen regulatory protein PII